MTESIDRLFDEGNGVKKEHSIRGGEYVALTDAIVEPVNEDVTEKHRRLKKKRKAAGDASGSNLPSKKLRDDYGTSGASASTATVHLVTSSVTPTPEREGGDHIDSVSGPNLRTKPAAMRFVISSDSSHHSGTHAVDVEVSSLVMSIVSDPPIITMAVTTTIAVETSLVSVSKVKVKPINSTLFGDSMLTSGHDVAGPSSPVHPELSVYSFYAIQDLNPETLHRVYIPKWYVTNESVLDAPYMFPCQTCLCVEVRMREEHILRKKKILEEECVHQTNLLKEKDVEIANLKSQLSLKEAEAAKAIRLRDHVATVEATKALHVAELNLLKERNYTLEAKMRASEEKAAALKSEKSSLTDQFCFHKCLPWRPLVSNFTIKSLVMSFLKNKLKPYRMSRSESLLRRSRSASRLQPSYEQLMLPIHRTEDNVVLGETSLSFSLEVIHNRIQRIRGDVEARRLSLSDAMVPLIEPLSFENLLGEASTSGVPVTADAVTTLSTTFAQSVSVLVPPLLVAD
nr:hypothetical protein [Tanacetum cinerariifolium]